MDYGKVLARAWEITWRWKVLWILGFLAALGSGGGGGGGSSSYTSNGDDWDKWGHTFIEPEFTAQILAIVAVVACLALIIGIAIWVVSVSARGGLIAGVQQVEEEGETSFGSAWRAGARRFWTLFGISFLAAIPLIILVVAGMIVLIMMFVGSGFAFASSDVAGGTGIAVSILCGGLFCCGMIIVSILLQQIRTYAERAAILEDLGWIDAVVRGWNVLKDNLGPTIIFWIIFLVIGFLFAMVILAVLAAVALPFIALVATVDSAWWMVAPVCCGGLVAVVVGSLISAIVTTFTSATWTLAYRELAGLTGVPRAESADEPEAEADEEAVPEE